MAVDSHTSVSPSFSAGDFAVGMGIFRIDAAAAVAAPKIGDR